MDPKAIVRAGYDRAAAEYETWSARIDASPRARYLSVIAQLVEPGATVLELGCGTGLATRELTTRFDVIGVDFSAACLALARINAPLGRYVQADVTRLGIRSSSVNAVVAFYSLIHVPREEHAALLQQCSEWLRSDGLFVATMGSGDLPAGRDDDWRGVEMYWSSYDAATNINLVREAGFEVLQADEVTQEEDGEIFSFLWIVARRAGQGPDPRPESGDNDRAG